MEFRPEAVQEFEELFGDRKSRIRGFEGCLHLELWKESGAGNVFFTYSHWESEAALNHYRFSGFFKDTWSRTKALFDAPPQAWSVGRQLVVEG